MKVYINTFTQSFFIDKIIHFLTSPNKSVSAQIERKARRAPHTPTITRKEWKELSTKNLSVKK